MIRRASVPQLGFGFGKGRRVIRTIYAGDRLQAALARPRDGCRRHGVEDAAPTACPNAAHIMRSKEHLRMAKADLRRETTGARTTTAHTRGGLEGPRQPRVPLRANDSSSSLSCGDPLASYTAHE
jgi:hypothetical protein